MLVYNGETQTRDLQVQSVHLTHRISYCIYYPCNEVPMVGTGQYLTSTTTCGYHVAICQLKFKFPTGSPPKMEGDSAEPMDLDAEEFAAQKAAATSKKEAGSGPQEGEVSRRLLAVAEACKVLECIRDRKGVCGKLLSSVNPSSR